MNSLRRPPLRRRTRDLRHGWWAKRTRLPLGTFRTCGDALTISVDRGKLPLSIRETNLARLRARRIDGNHLAPFEQGEIGPDPFRHACLMWLERLVSKHRESPYRSGRSDRWIKVKNRQHAAFSRVMDAFA